MGGFLGKSWDFDKECLHIGHLETTSPCMPSYFGDQDMFFRHHDFLEDIRQRPDWSDEVDRIDAADLLVPPTEAPGFPPVPRVAPRVEVSVRLPTTRAGEAGALRQLLADELATDVALLRVMECDDAGTPRDARDDACNLTQAAWPLPDGAPAAVGKRYVLAAFAVTPSGGANATGFLPQCAGAAERVFRAPVAARVLTAA
eukprot:gene4986-415_t